MVPWRQPRVRVCMSVLPLASLCGCCSCAADAFQPWMWKQLCVVLNCACKPCGNQGEASGWCPRAATHACMQPLMCVCDGVRPWCTLLLLLCNAAVAVAGAVATMGCCCCHCLLLPPLLLPPLLQQHHHAPHHHHKQQPHHQPHHHQKQQHLAITNPHHHQKQQHHRQPHHHHHKGQAVWAAQRRSAVGPLWARGVGWMIT